MASSTRADSARDRIIAAATAEFSRYGIAGARIDRIAREAKTSKERLYAYFSSKEDLYRFISSREFAAMTDATRLDPADLPGCAGRLHDYFTAQPDRVRLLIWGQLELGPGQSTSDDPFLTHKLEQLRQAQEAGQLDPSWDPLDILVLVNRIATSWAAHPYLGPAAGSERDVFLKARRDTIVAIVQRLFPATGDDATG